MIIVIILIMKKLTVMRDRLIGLWGWSKLFPLR